MEEKEQKFTAKVIDKAMGKTFEDVSCVLTKSDFVIETEQPIRIPLVRMKDLELIHEPVYENRTEVRRSATLKLSYFDDLNWEQQLSFEMAHLDAVDLRDTLRSAMSKLRAEAWALLPLEKKCAGFWIRFLASLIDGIILNVIGWIFTFLFAAVPGMGYIGWIIGLVYVIGFWTWRGQTPGKMVVGVKIVKTDGSSIGVDRAILRYIGYIVSTITLLIGYLWIAWDSRKQGLHDKIAGTYVIKLA